MAVNERRIAIVGAGRIGEALLSGLLSSGWRDASELVVSDHRAPRVASSRSATASSQRPTTPEAIRDAASS